MFLLDTTNKRDQHSNLLTLMSSSTIWHASKGLTRGWSKENLTKEKQKPRKPSLSSNSLPVRHRWTFLTVFWSFPSRYCTGIWNLICPGKALFNSLLSKLLFHIPSNQQTTLFTGVKIHPVSQFGKFSHQQQLLSCISYFQFNTANRFLR